MIVIVTERKVFITPIFYSGSERPSSHRVIARPLRLVNQHLIRLHYLPKSLLALLASRVLVRMPIPLNEGEVPDLGEVSVLALDFGNRGTRVDAELLVMVVALRSEGHVVHGCSSRFCPYL